MVQILKFTPILFFFIINNDIRNPIKPIQGLIPAWRVFFLFTFWCLFKMPGTLQMSCKNKCLFIKALCFTIK